MPKRWSERHASRENPEALISANAPAIRGVGAVGDSPQLRIRQRRFQQFAAVAQQLSNGRRKPAIGRVGTNFRVPP
jgi:hypothetical protein